MRDYYSTTTTVMCYFARLLAQEMTKQRIGMFLGYGCSMPHVRDCKYLDKWYLPMFVMGQISESARLLVVYGVLILVVCCSGYTVLQ